MSPDGAPRSISGVSGKNPAGPGALVVSEAGGALAALEALREAGTGRGVFVAQPRPEPAEGEGHHG